MRLLTALSIFAISALTAFWGWQTVGFSVVLASAAEAPARAPDRLLRWVGVPGLTVEALEASLRDPKSPGALSPVVREVELRALLAVHPMSSQAWLSLAGDRLVLGQPASEVTSALAMSWITGPNEGAVMWQRGVFGLAIWNLLSADQRREAVGDIVGAMRGHAVGDQWDVAKGVLTQLPSATRAEVADALQMAGLSSKEMADIGLFAANQ